MRHPQYSSQKSHCQETNNRTRLRNNQDVRIISDFKVVITNMLKDLVEKVDNICEQIEKFIGEMETVRVTWICHTHTNHR